MKKILLYQFISLLPENASEGEVEKAYKSLALHYHPDKNPQRKEWAEEKMKQLNEAKEILSNPTKRAAYLQDFKDHQVAQVNRTRTLQRENSNLRKKLDSSNKTNAVLGFALLLLGGALLSGD